jgi:hypothetical protein
LLASFGGESVGWYEGCAWVGRICALSGRVGREFGAWALLAYSTHALHPLPTTGQCMMLAGEGVAMSLPSCRSSPSTPLACVALLRGAGGNSKGLTPLAIAKASPPSKGPIAKAQADSASDRLYSLNHGPALCGLWRCLLSAHAVCCRRSPLPRGRQLRGSM